MPPSMASLVTCATLATLSPLCYVRNDSLPHIIDTVAERASNTTWRLGIARAVPAEAAPATSLANDQIF